MEKEFYHKDIFGEIVDIDLNASGEEVASAVAVTSRASGFNVFSLTDAFASRRKKEAWILYRKALASGLSVEEVFFKIFWQVKSMLLASRTKSVGETDMKPFPYNKSKIYSKNFERRELEKLSERLISGYCLARQGDGEIETLVEKTILEL